MGNLTVKAKLGLLVLISIATLLLVGVSGWVGISKVSSTASQLGDTNLPAVIALSDVRSSQYALYAYTLEAATWEKEKYANAQFKNILERKTKATAALDAALKTYAKQTRTEDEEKAWKTLEPGLKRWREFDVKLNEVITQLGNNDEFEKQAELFEKYYFYVTDWKDAQYAVERNLGKLVDLNAKYAKEAGESGKTARKAAIGAMLSVFGIAVVVLLVLGWVFFKSITGALDKMRRAITSVAANNDFTIRADVKSNDETGQTARAFNQLVEQMQTSLREVLSNAASISEAAHKASAASRQVSNASTSQSESASAMAAAIEEMTVSINHITDSTRDAQHRAQEAGSAADSGATIIAQTNSEMDHIAGTVQTAGETINDLGRQSDKISGIMQVIKEVADQTNLLALNAAIEAARAGEQGRGFAVVADEVRKLAERTRKATEEISQMVVTMQGSARNAVTGMDSVVSRVFDGKELSDQAATRMNEIQGSATQVSEAINEISAALHEQSAAAQDIARQVEVVARMSEDNSHAAQETANISEELDGFARALKDAAARFKV
ncbi:methyl-accepting chemotaxis protein [Niveibacterium sp. 24ML]|uniref:methyl-accepting chemotaxis protein n=1 Tax=Niveibacterium sp. 24ML TaxID=2985512 RepID=UPI00226EE132|nr:methyl-accepting chemotaxis protein [Niveibacterium sp. 24ML]MCX9158453.1 methyl-accepting chemotaxis protein [Niveibacterium sp. 24ML]